MRIISTILGSLLSLTSMTAHAQVVQQTTSSMTKISADVLNYAQKVGAENVLVAYDIDNTLLAPADGYDLATTQWWDWQSDLIANHCSVTPNYCVGQDISQLLKVNDIVLSLMQLNTIEQGDADFIAREQTEKMNVIALTSRGYTVFSATDNQLKKNAIDMSLTSLGKATDPQGIAGYFTTAGFTRPMMYTNGIMLTNGQDKGKALQFLLHYYNKSNQIKVIVFVDDTPGNIAKVAAAFQDNSEMTVYTYLYTAEKDRYDAFMKNPKDKVNQQWLDVKQALEKSFHFQG